MTAQPKKSARRWLLIAAALTVAFGLAACDDSDNEFDNTDAADGLDADAADGLDADSVDGDTEDDSDGSDGITPLPENVLPANNQFARPRNEGRACPEEDYSATPPPGTPPVNLPTEGRFDKLSEYNFFWGEMRDMQPNNGVYPYTTVSYLWADGTGKARFLVLPEGQKATLTDDEWQFPEGSIVVKSFMMPNDEREPNCGYKPLETRLLVRRNNDWISYTYEWNEEGTDATFISYGKDLTVDLINKNGDYESRPYYIPQINECSRCHGRSDGPDQTAMDHLLGVDTRQMNALVLRDGQYVNQIEWFEEQGFFDADVPASDTLPAFVNPMDEAADMHDRAMSYFYANCAHCHQGSGVAGRSQLYLEPEVDSRERHGICKKPLATGPGAGGLSYDVVPGHPDASILLYRMRTQAPQARMPELATQKIDDYGVALISDWIEQLEPGACTAEFE